MRWVAAVFAAAAAILLSHPQVADAQSAPAGLQGKSAIVSWTENRTQRNLGEERTETVAVPYTYRVYFSTAGRPFARLTVANRRGETGSRERVGTGARAGDGGARSLQMRGNSLTATSGHGGGARRIEVKFDGSSGCSASVILGKQSGAQKIVMRNIVSGKRMEILSSTTSAASCSLQNGNVFEN